MVDNNNNNGTLFVIKRNLHSTMKSSLKEKPFRCGKCWRTFSRKQNYDRHVETHEDKKLFGCSVCGKGFKIAGDLQKHVQSQHFDTVDDYTANEICNEKFTNMKDYERRRKSSKYVKVNFYSWLENCGSGVGLP